MTRVAARSRPAVSAEAGVDFGHRTIVLRLGGIALRWRMRAVVVCAVLAAVTLAVTMLALSLGDYPLTPAQVLAAIGDPDAGFARTVVVEWRAPRAIAAVAFGAALGASGALFQSLVRNPLASPDIIGVSTGSYTGALVVIVVVHGTYLQLVGGAIVGGVATAALVAVCSWGRRMRGFRLIIVGIAVSAMLASFNTWLMLTADLEVARTAAAWGAGSLSAVGWTPALVGGLVIAALLVATAAVAPALRQLELGDDAAKATGARAGVTSAAVVALGVALVAVVTAAAGPITFIALAAPQIARRVARTPGVGIAASTLMGALLLATADVIGQHAVPVALPVGVVTVVIGGAYLVWLITREIRRRRG